MNLSNTLIISDIWIEGTWEQYLLAIQELNNKTARCYYYQNQYQIEMTPMGNDHACDHNIIMYAVNLYATIKGINFTGKDACSYRKIGYAEAQPDASYYIGENCDIIPYGTSIVDLEQYNPPDLVIEISATTLADDLGNKRLLYEELGIPEYWVVDVKKNQVIAFKIIDKGSQRIEISQVLPGLEMKILNEALRRTRQTNHSIVGQWLIQKFQEN